MKHYLFILSTIVAIAFPLSASLAQTGSTPGATSPPSAPSVTQGASPGFGTGGAGTFGNAGGTIGIPGGTRPGFGMGGTGTFGNPGGTIGIPGGTNPGFGMSGTGTLGTPGGTIGIPGGTNPGFGMGGTGTIGTPRADIGTPGGTIGIPGGTTPGFGTGGTGMLGTPGATGTPGIETFGSGTGSGTFELPDLNQTDSGSTPGTFGPGR